MVDSLVMIAKYYAILGYYVTLRSSFRYSA